jgi:Protein of unknown function (DUF2950)
VAAAGGGKKAMIKLQETSGKRERTNFRNQSFALLLLWALCSGLALLPSAARSEPGKSQESQTMQKMFNTPDQAADALIQAAQTFNVPVLHEILGPNGEGLISSKDPVRDKNIASAFARKARQKHEVTPDPEDHGRTILSVGNDDWPLPIPIVQKDGKWFFDTKAGREEMLFRRIGANELDAIQICHGYVDAQEQYALQRHGGVNQYAQQVISTPGKQDGLAWKNPDGSWGGPIGEAIAKAIAQGYTNRRQPYHGYFFKILKGQGPAAPLGRMDFVVEGAMIGGFALAAAPAEYRVTGVKTFVVGYQGIVYQKDLGPNTLSIFKNMQLYDPDKTWIRTDDNW